MAFALDQKELNDLPEDHSFVTVFNSLPAKQETTIRFFDHNDYYKVYGNDAHFVAKELFKTSAVIKCIRSGNEKLDYANISKMNFESFVRELLLVRAYRIEIFKNRTSGKSHEWKLITKASPGNFVQLEELLFGSSDAAEAKGVIAIKLKAGAQQLNVGVAYGDIVMRQLLVAEFSDDNNFTNLQALLIQLGPKECLLQTNDQSSYISKLKEIMERSNVLVSECKAADLNTNNLVQDLNRLLKFKNGEQNQSDILPEFELSLAIAGIAAVIKYLELMGDSRNFGQFSLGQFNLDQFMRLDSAAVRALGLLSLDNELAKSKTLMGLLNKCRTTAGQRLLTQWLKQPLIDVNKINERLNIVEAFVKNTELRQTLYEDNLRKIPDLHKFSKKFQAKRANLQDCYRVYQIIEHLPKLRKNLESFSGPQESQISEVFCAPLTELENDFEKYQEMVQSTIDLEQIENGEFLVRSDFDDDLREYHSQMGLIEERMKADFLHVSRDLNLETEKILKLETAPQFGWHYRVTKKGEQALRSKKNYPILSTQNKGILFHSSKLKSLNDEYQNFKLQYEEHQKSIVELIMKIASGYCEPLNHLNDVLAPLDVLVAFAVVAVTAPKPYVRPVVEYKGSGKIILEEARHPLVEIQENIDFIPNDVSLQHGSSNFHIITGPNMGGKSTYIRSVALNVLLAQIGSFVACDKATISVVDTILTRVGAGDRQLKGVSTFMAEMLETAHILRSATKDSLVIIDELGRGTSTYDGFGLAWAISEHIVKDIGSCCLFATHFHELTSLATEYPTVKNLHVSALTTSETLTLLYKVKPGICDQSFGIHVAELANFPKEIIDLAKEKVSEFEDFQGMVMSNEEEPKHKKRKTESTEEIIDSFFGKIKEIPIASLSEEQIMSRLSELKLELQESGNEKITTLLSKIQAKDDFV